MSSDVSIEATKQAVDEFMRAIFKRRLADAQHVGPRYSQLWQHIETVTMTGGKRFRPYLSVIAYGKLDDAILPIAAAQEFVHIGLLMHDDVIDQDFVRRGHKNINGIYRDEYSQHLNNERATHYANSAGILAGDTLLSEAYRLIAASDFTEKIKSQAADQVGVSILEVIGGELLDVEAAFIRDVTYDPITIYRYKTASYSFVGPLLVGAYCSGSDEQTIEVLTNFAIDFGIAFQIQDDLLGVFGDEAETGKSTVTDMLEGKRTLLVEHHEHAMNNDMRTRFNAYGDPEATAEKLEAIKLDMIESGARDKTLQDIETYLKSAANHLEKLKDEKQKSRLQELLKTMGKRRL
jgi:geranylgeranyl diphosphate synthase type II